jgi:hypothetical protein
VPPYSGLSHVKKLKIGLGIISKLPSLKKHLQAVLAISFDCFGFYINFKIGKGKYKNQTREQ